MNVSIMSPFNRSSPIVDIKYVFVLRREKNIFLNNIANIIYDTNDFIGGFGPLIASSPAESTHFVMGNISRIDHRCLEECPIKIKNKWSEHEHKWCLMPSFTRRRTYNVLSLSELCESRNSKFVMMNV